MTRFIKITTAQKAASRSAQAVRAHPMYCGKRDLGNIAQQDRPTILEVGGSRPIGDVGSLGAGAQEMDIPLPPQPTSDKRPYDQSDRDEAMRLAHERIRLMQLGDAKLGRAVLERLAPKPKISTPSPAPGKPGNKPPVGAPTVKIK